MSTTATHAQHPKETHTLIYAHGTVMVIAWMIFASTGILFARYGRSLRIGTKEKLLGEAIWFQIHRLILCMATITTLLGFFLILAETQGEWLRSNEGFKFIHSILGGIIVCCALFQAWMALFRCHPNSPFRFIYNWIHRTTGCLAFLLSVPTIFLIVVEMKIRRAGLIAILSLWSVWVVIIVVLFEMIDFRLRTISSKVVDHTEEYELPISDSSPSVNMKPGNNADDKFLNKIRLILFLAHIIVALALAIPLIVNIWQQN